MKTIRWLVTSINFTLVLILGAMGMYYFGALGAGMRALDFQEKYCPGLYFADAEIPTWNPEDYVREPDAKTRRRTLAEDYPYIAIPMIVIPDGCGSTLPPLTLDEILRNKVDNNVYSVVYSPDEPGKSGCYLTRFLKFGGKGMYYHTPGDSFVAPYTMRDGTKAEKVFSLAEIREVVGARKYEIVFRTADGGEVVWSYERLQKYSILDRNER